MVDGSREILFRRSPNRGDLPLPCVGLAVPRDDILSVRDVDLDPCVLRRIGISNVEAQENQAEPVIDCVGVVVDILPDAIAYEVKRQNQDVLVRRRVTSGSVIVPDVSPLESKVQIRRVSHDVYLH